MLRDAEAGAIVRFVYIRAHERTALDGIESCRCRLFFALGTDWDEAAERFREDRSYSVFDDLLLFEESETERLEFSVTLHPVLEGKAKTTLLSEAEFDRQLGKRH